MSNKPYVPSLKSFYYDTIVSEVKKELNLSSVMEVPKLNKIVVNVGMGSEAVVNSKSLDPVVESLSLITGQAATKTKARKSIASFKLREGMPIGVMVTLRGNIMYEFLERLIHLSLPRVRDFNGLSSKSFDNAGNYTFGIKEHIVFPEIDFDKVTKIHGMDITIAIKTKKKEYSRLLLEKFNFPFKKG